METLRRARTRGYLFQISSLKIAQEGNSVVNFGENSSEDASMKNGGRITRRQKGGGDLLIQ